MPILPHAVSMRRRCPTTLTTYPGRQMPAWFRDQPWIHRTAGDWDGHE
jgi:hypothetical protein